MKKKQKAVECPYDKSKCQRAECDNGVCAKCIANGHWVFDCYGSRFVLDKPSISPRSDG